MAKEKQPLLSLEAHGSIADALTYQRSKGQNIARSKPRLPYFRTLPVQYQRWLYQDYAYLWRQQTAAIQKAYRALGVRFHLTGFQYWMKYQLTNLPDIAGMWYLDVNNQPTTPDYSRNGNTATVIGASPAEGLIDGCLSFDGLNDYVNCGNDESLQITTEITVEAFVYLNAYHPTSYSSILSKANNIAGPVWYRGYCLEVRNDGTFDWFCGSAVVRKQLSAGTLSLATPHHVGGTWDGTTMRQYLDGLDIGNIAFAGPIYTTYDLLLSQLLPGSSRWLNGWEDHVIVYNRALDATEMLRHSLRAYPR